MARYSLLQTPKTVKIRVIRRGRPQRFDVVRREGRAWLTVGHYKTRARAYEHLERLLTEHFGWDKNCPAGIRSVGAMLKGE